MLSIDKKDPVPLYRQVFSYFRDRIVDGSLAPGDCLPSLRGLQRDLGVGRESIKRAMAELDAEGLVQRVQGKGTFVARRRARRRFWGVVVPFYAEFYNQMIVELRRVAHGLALEIEHACDYDDWLRQIAIVNDFAWQRAEAVIVVPTRDEPKAIHQLQKIAARQPLVLFDRTSIASQLPYVIQDYVLGVRSALEAMEGAGARRIGYVRDPLWIGANPIYQTMEQAYRHACEEMASGYCRFWSSPYDFTSDELAKPDYDALMCVNDQVACLMTGLLRQHGASVPGRVQVCGYNDSDVGRFFTPRITTTSPDLPYMCELVSTIIQRFTAGERVEQLQYIMMPRIVPGGTTRTVHSQAENVPAARQD